MLEQKEHKFDILGKDFDIKNIGKVTGEEKYSCDINIPGQLYAVVLRSPYACLLYTSYLKATHTKRVDLIDICKGCGVEKIEIIDPYKPDEAIKVFEEAIKYQGVSVIAVSYTHLKRP